jgi:hypothetical protein
MKTVRLKDRLISVVVLIAGLILGAVCVGPAEAQANALVSLKLTVPSGHPGAIIVEAVFTKDAVVVGEFTGILAVSGGSASVSLSVTEEPNGVQVEYRIPFDGTQTTYAISPADFAFDTEYFLPDPSPGGVIPPETIGDPATDAFLVVSIVEVSDDTVAPTCDIDSSDPSSIEATIQDVDSGLAEIGVRTAKNVSVEVPDFDPGTTDPVIVTATVVNPDRSWKLGLKAIDQAGNQVYCIHYGQRKVKSRRRSF